MKHEYEINGIKIKSSNFYLNKHDRQVIHTSMRSDLYKELTKIATKLNRPKSKCLDVLVLTLKNHPEIYKEFVNSLKKY